MLRGRLRLTWLVAAGCLLVILAAALPRVYQAGQDLTTQRRVDAAAQVVGGMVVRPGAPEALARFMLAARNHIPDRAPYRLQVGPGTNCGSDRLVMFWIAYELLPRAGVCAGDPRWWVLYRAGKIPVPTGSRVVWQAKDMALVESPQGRHE